VWASRQIVSTELLLLYLDSVKALFLLVEDKRKRRWDGWGVRAMPVAMVEIN
jgi:hypothetical protein